MSYVRPSHSSKFRDGSDTDGTVTYGALATGLEAVEEKLDGATEYGLGLLTPTDAAEARGLLGFPLAYRPISLTFDDALAEHYDIAVRMAEHGMRGTFCITTGFVGGSVNLTWSQVQEIAAMGHEIACHGATHTNLTTLTLAQIRTELDTAMAAFADHGLAPTTLVLPYNAGNADVLDAANGVFDLVAGSASRVAVRSDSQITPEFLAAIKSEVPLLATPAFYMHGESYGAPEPSTSSVLAMLDTLADQGALLLPLRETHPPTSFLLDGSFEKPAGTAGPSGWAIVKSGDGASEVATVTPATSLAGSKALHLTSTSGSIYQYQILALPMEPLTLVGYYKASGGGASVRACTADIYLGRSYSPFATKALPNQAGWTRFTFDFTPTTPLTVLDLLSNQADVTFDALTLVRRSTLGGTAPGLGITYTVHPYFAAALNVDVASANRCIYYRITQGGGVISKIGFQVVTQSGNMSISAFANTGAGLSAQPGARLATSGAVAVPATGYRELTLDAPVTVAVGDWLAISCDNTTAKFAGNNAASSSLLAGAAFFQDTAHPAPSTAAPGGPANRAIPLIGVP